MVVRPASDGGGRPGAPAGPLRAFARAIGGLAGTLAAVVIAACGPRAVPQGPTPSGARLAAQASGTTALLQAVSAVNERVVWVSGHRATYARTTDGGVVSGQFSGIASLAFRDTLHGVALGGRLGAHEEFSDNVAVTADGGRTWTLATRTPFPGAVYGAVCVPLARGPVLVAAGPRGLALSRDDARTWTSLDTAAFWAVGFASPRAGWAVGPGGRITRISLP